MKRCVIFLILILFPCIGIASVPKVYWEHDGVNVTSFKCVVDGGTPTTLSPTQSGITYSVDITNCTGIMVDGPHSLVIQACNGTSCASSVAITVVKL